MPGAFCVLLAAARERENMKSSSSITFYAFSPLALANSSQKDSPTYVVVLTSSQYLEQNRTIPRNTCCKFFKPRSGRPHLRISRYQQRISEIFLSLISVKSFASSRVRTADLESHSPLLYHRAMQNCCETMVQLKGVN